MGKASWTSWPVILSKLSWIAKFEELEDLINKHDPPLNRALVGIRSIWRSDQISRSGPTLNGAPENTDLSP